MRTFIITVLSILLSLNCVSQSYNCLDSLSAVYATTCTYSVDSFPSKTPVDINISRILFHGREITVNFSYHDKIEFETPVLPITDSVAIKLLLSQSRAYGKYRYYFHLLTYHKEGNCWIEDMNADLLQVVAYQKFSISDYMFSSPNIPIYFTIIEGSIRLN